MLLQKDPLIRKVLEHQLLHGTFTPTVPCQTVLGNTDGLAGVTHHARAYVGPDQKILALAKTVATATITISCNKTRNQTTIEQIKYKESLTRQFTNEVVVPHLHVHPVTFGRLHHWQIKIKIKINKNGSYKIKFHG